MIIGQKVIIRPMELGDEEYLCKWWSSGEVMSHATFKYGILQTKDTIRKKIEKDIEVQDFIPQSKRFIICRKEDLAPIGEMSYSSWDKRNQKCEFGIKICETQEQGKGYGYDALYYFIDYMFSYLNLNKIELTTMIDNKRAHNFYEKLGFIRIGVIRDAFYDSRVSTFSDCVYMDLLKSEWKAIKYDNK